MCQAVRKKKVPITICQSHLLSAVFQACQAAERIQKTVTELIQLCPTDDDFEEEEPQASQPLSAATSSPAPEPGISVAEPDATSELDAITHLLSQARFYYFVG